MKRTLLLLSLWTVLSTGIYGQAGLSDYIRVVIGFTESGQHLEALKVCERLASLYPDNADVHFLRGINHYILKEYQSAIRDFDRTVELNPDYPDVYLYRAKARKAGKDYWGALKDYNRARDRNFAQTVTSLAGDLLKSIFSGG
jgi:tetratricopeptide (TPR) repeat protein